MESQGFPREKAIIVFLPRSDFSIPVLTDAFFSEAQKA